MTKKQKGPKVLLERFPLEVREQLRPMLKIPREWLLAFLPDSSVTIDGRNTRTDAVYWTVWLSPSFPDESKPEIFYVASCNVTDERGNIGLLTSRLSSHGGMASLGVRWPPPPGILQNPPFKPVNPFVRTFTVDVALYLPEDLTSKIPELDLANNRATVTKILYMLPPLPHFFRERKTPRRRLK